MIFNELAGSNKFKGKGCKNKNFIGQDGIIHNIYVGDQTSETIEKTIQELLVLVSRKKSENKPVLILTDITQIGKIGLVVRKKGLEAMITLKYDKLAIFGRDDLYKSFIKLMIVASGNQYKIMHFSTEYQAKDWLKSFSLSD